MRRTAYALMVGGIATALATSPAAAQEVCGDHKEIVSRLAEDFAESRVGIGLGNDGRVVELFASRDGSWTMLVTRPDGPTCLIDAGEAWESPTVPVSGPTA